MYPSEAFKLLDVSAVLVSIVIEKYIAAPIECQSDRGYAADLVCWSIGKNVCGSLVLPKVCVCSGLLILTLIILLSLRARADLVCCNVCLRLCAESVYVQM